MTDPLATYVHDHLAGAEFAVNLLEDFRDQEQDERLRTFAKRVLPEIEADRAVLNELAERLGDEGNVMKEAVAWIAQKASRVKLGSQDALGAFESVEMLCIGILGKLGLWNALLTLAPDNRIARLDLKELIARATQQHAGAEKLRLELAKSALVAPE